MEKSLNLERLRPLFNWGEGIFTSFSVKEGKILFKNAHKLRLGVQFKILYGEDFKKSISDIFNFISHKKFSGRGRITLFRDSFGAHSSLLELTSFDLGGELSVKSMKKNFSYSSSLKLPHYALRFKELRELKKDGFHDFLSLSVDEDCLEFSTSNIFYMDKEHRLFLPFTPAIFFGITAHKISNFLEEKNLKINNGPLLYKDITDDGFLFALNSVHGMRRVLRLDQKIMNNKKLSLFTEIKNFIEDSYE